MQPPRGEPFEHAGSVHAVDAESALQNARDVYARRGEAVNIWVVPTAAITASTPDDVGTVLRSRKRQALPASAVLLGAARRARLAGGLAARSTASRRRPSGMVPALDGPVRAALVQYLLRLGDDRLVLGHRLSEWCGHAPILEEDIALANIALDLVGQATLLLESGGANRRRRDATQTRSPICARQSTSATCCSSSCRKAISPSRSCGSSCSAWRHTTSSKASPRAAMPILRALPARPSRRRATTSGMPASG